ncbi:MAG: copper chaperone PCu(A)C [Gammaproteobacteria bacterium]|nr:copper chaperone PCu(A)C [Gammaproteobacteria bacterium]
MRGAHGVAAAGGTIAARLRRYSIDASVALFLHRHAGTDRHGGNAGAGGRLGACHAAGARTAAVYGTLVNKGDEAATVSNFRVERASRAHLHSTISEDGMMKMRPADDLVIAPGEAVRLEPGGMHIMLMGLAEPLEEGSSFLITVSKSTGDESTAVVEVGGFGRWSHRSECDDDPRAPDEGSTPGRRQARRGRGYLSGNSCERT